MSCEYSNPRGPLMQRCFLHALHRYQVLGSAMLLIVLMPVVASAQTNSVESLTLIDADRNVPIAGYDPIPNGAVLNLAALPPLSIRANVSGAVASVQFVLNWISPFEIENVAPYAIAADQEGDYFRWHP